MVKSTNSEQGLGELALMLSGATGQLGQAICSLVEGKNQHQVVARYDRQSGFSEQPLGDVVIDVSHYAQTPKIVAFAVEHQLPLVIGTTALSDATQVAIEEASHEIAICQASNFSVGANVLMRLVAMTAEALPGFEIHIKETHHRHKIDAPSGTTKSLQAAMEAVGVEGVTHESIREGEVVGTHAVTFSGPDESISLTHEATDRGVFARGALLAAERLVGRPPGLYALTDLI